MSSKNAKQEKRTPRAMPVETILTRFKSAQQKQLLGNDQINNMKTKNNSTKKKSNVNSAKNKIMQQIKSKKLDKPLKKSNLKKPDIQLQNNEYYPNKLKRKVLNARIFLAPKHSLKIICGTKSANKRKLHLPQKDIKCINESADSISAIHKPSEISIVDMVRVIEESGNLDDEDLLEILTCPSPVWWEEPPDGYIEEALFSQPRLAAEKVSIKNQLLEEKNKEDELNPNIKKDELIKDSTNKESDRNLSDSLDICIETRDENFINKRCKLETLLGNIKNKTNNIPLRCDDNDIKSDRNSFDSDEVEIKSENDIKMELCPEENEVETKHENEIKMELFPEENEVEIKNENEIEMELCPEENELEINYNEKRSSDFTEEDLLDFRDDYLLSHLENLEIPIEAKQEPNIFNIENFEKSPDNSRRESIESNSSDKIMTEEYLDLSLLDDDDKNDDGDEIKIIIDKNEISNVIKDIDDENGICDEIKNIDEFSTSNSDENNRVNVFEVINKVNNLKNNNDFVDKTDVENDLNVDFKRSIEINSEQFDKSKNEFVTVYQIINNDDNIELNNSSDEHKINEKTNGKDLNNKKIHRYYKCQKLSNRHRRIEKKNKKVVVENKNNSIVISENDKIKYCFICSAIFDTDECNYCSRKNLKRKTDEFECDTCGAVVNSKQDIIEHLINHN